ncbi:MAG: NlpC/P60 family protein [Pseudomonadota bacterium]
MSDVSGRVVEAARGWIGTPYRHQGSCKGAGADCLGLIRGVWREVLGKEPEPVPAYTMDWSEPQKVEDLWQAATRHFLPKDLRDEAPGDLLLFRMRDGGVAKHLGLAGRLGAEASFIHAYSRHAVVESPLSTPWRRRIVARFAFPQEV